MKEENEIVKLQLQYIVSLHLPRQLRKFCETQNVKWAKQCSGSYPSLSLNPPVLKLLTHMVLLGELLKCLL